MLEPQIDLVRAIIDGTAERIATLGESPNGLLGALVSERAWAEYSLGRVSTQEHPNELDRVYDGIVASRRGVIAATGDTDPVRLDMLHCQTAKLELFQ